MIFTAVHQFPSNHTSVNISEAKEHTVSAEKKAVITMLVVQARSSVFDSRRTTTEFSPFSISPPRVFTK